MIDRSASNSSDSRTRRENTCRTLDKERRMRPEKCCQYCLKKCKGFSNGVWIFTANFQPKNDLNFFAVYNLL